MKKSLFTCLALSATLILIIVSCKKNETQQLGSSTSPGTTTGSTTTGSTTGSTGSTTGSTTGNPSGIYNGDMGKYTIDFNGTTYSSNQAAFWTSPVPLGMTASSPLPTASVNSVEMNGIQLKFIAANLYYTDTTSTYPTPPVYWNITGAGSIPSFSYTDNTPFPTFSGLSSLSTTVNKSQNLIIPLNGVSGADQIRIQFGDSLYNSTSVTVAGTAVSVTILKDSLTKMLPCASGHYYLDFIKYNPQVLGSKNFMFTTLKSFYKDSVKIQ